MEHDTINHVRTLVVDKVPRLLGDDLNSIILFGSCARGDYDEDSDIDVAVLTHSGTDYHKSLCDVSYDAMENENAVLNFICISDAEFQDKNAWYPFYKNIRTQGVKWYG